MHGVCDYLITFLKFVCVSVKTLSIGSCIRSCFLCVIWEHEVLQEGSKIFLFEIIWRIYQEWFVLVYSFYLLLLLTNYFFFTGRTTYPPWKLWRCDGRSAIKSKGNRSWDSGCHPPAGDTCWRIQWCPSTGQVSFQHHKGVIIWGWIGRPQSRNAKCAFACVWKHASSLVRMSTQSPRSSSYGRRKPPRVLI